MRPRRRWFRWTASLIAAVLALVAVGVVVYSHTLSAPDPLRLPPLPAGAAEAPALDGVWRVGPGSTVGWRVHQVLLGQQSTLVSRTGRVWGVVTIADGSVTEASFTADVAALTSNPAQRTVFGADRYPTATLVLAKPIALGELPSQRAAVRYAASGDLTFHGITRVVSFTVSAERAGSAIAVLVELAMPFPEWDISIQGVPFFADLESPATAEVLLDLTRGPGNQASVRAGQ